VYTKIGFMAFFFSVHNSIVCLFNRLVVNVNPIVVIVVKLCSLWAWGCVFSRKKVIRGNTRYE